jgi:hypothetical protein
MRRAGCLGARRALVVSTAAELRFAEDAARRRAQRWMREAYEEADCGGLFGGKRTANSE